MPEINGADSVFIFICTALVMLMTPALALFYGGLVKSKNVLSTTMHSYAAIVIVSLQWVLIGYSLSFGSDIKGIIGGLDYIGLKDVGFAPLDGFVIPHNLFMMFQLMFAALTVALISGAFAERMRFSAFVLFALLWTTFVYDPLAHWVWGGGWIMKMGALDFAGGNVVHISSGVSGLVLAIYLGKRKDASDSAPHHLPFTVLGAGMLWFGWFGFNVGSALSLNEVAMNAFVTTNLATAAAAASWVACEWIVMKKPTILGIVSGAVAGLVSITPACGFVTPLSSVLIGIIGGVICFGAVFYLKNKLGYDDALDAFGIHGIGGTWGGIATGLFATTTINEAGANGLFYGDASLLWKQLIAIVATYLFAGIATFVIIKVVSLITKVRVEEEEESIGLDIALHGEKAYHETV